MNENPLFFIDCLLEVDEAAFLSVYSKMPVTMEVSIEHLPLLSRMRRSAGAASSLCRIIISPIETSFQVIVSMI